VDSLGELQCTEELQGLDILQLYNIILILVICIMQLEENDCLSFNS
jgi:hypothetical protein